MYASVLVRQVISNRRFLVAILRERGGAGEMIFRTPKPMANPISNATTSYAFDAFQNRRRRFIRGAGFVQFGGSKIDGDRSGLTK
jgi:hypothetical protein